MKKIERIKLNDVVILNDNEMKMVQGGGSGDPGRHCPTDQLCTTVSDCPSSCRGCKPINNWAGSSACTPYA